MMETSLISLNMNHITGMRRRSLSYLPKYLMEGERKDRTKEVPAKVIEPSRSNLVMDDTSFFDTSCLNTYVPALEPFFNSFISLALNLSLLRK